MFEVTLIKEINAPVTHLPGGFIDPRSGATPVFVCGSLMDPAFIATIIGRPPATCPALATGFTRSSANINGAQTPFLIPAPGAVTLGSAILGLSETETQKIDAFEQTPNLRRKINLDGSTYPRLTIGSALTDGITYIKND